MAQFKKIFVVSVTFILVLFFLSSFLFSYVKSGNFWFSSSNVYAAESNEKEDSEPTKVKRMSDPLESVNRAFFKFNDKFYFWILKPASKVYKVIFPHFLRVGIRNGFRNLYLPVRFINSLLQVKPKKSGIILARFAINSTIGIAGFMDVAKHKLHLYPQDEDFGQTLGRYGLHSGFYIDWPILGPSSLRDTVGMAGDFFLDPIFYLSPNIITTGAIYSGQEVNNTSLRLGEYEDFKAATIDPYIALRNAYYQHRIKQVKE